MILSQDLNCYWISSASSNRFAQTGSRFQASSPQRSQRALGNGNISLADEIDLNGCGGKSVLALAFGGTTDGAALNALLTLNASFESAQEQYIQQWKSWHKSLPNPQRSNLVSMRIMVLRSHRSKQFSGAGVASLSMPWGEARCGCRTTVINDTVMPYLARKRHSADEVDKMLRARCKSTQSQ